MSQCDMECRHLTFFFWFLLRMNGIRLSYSLGRVCHYDGSNILLKHFCLKHFQMPKMTDCQSSSQYGWTMKDQLDFTCIRIQIRKTNINIVAFSCDYVIRRQSEKYVCNIFSKFLHSTGCVCRNGTIRLRCWKRLVFRCNSSQFLMIMADRQRCHMRRLLSHSIYADKRFDTDKPSQHNFQGFSENCWRIFVDYNTASRISSKFSTQHQRGSIVFLKWLKTKTETSKRLSVRLCFHLCLLFVWPMINCLFGITINISLWDRNVFCLSCYFVHNTSKHTILDVDINFNLNHVYCLLSYHMGPVRFAVASVDIKRHREPSDCIDWRDCIDLW